MSDPLATNHLSLPYLAPAQAQKHVTHNEALKRLDTVVQLAVISSGLADPPADPEEGDRYIVADSATGAWAGHDGEVAAFIDGAWDFAAAEHGWIAFDVAAEAMLVRTGDGWQAIGGFLGDVARLGINATADETNRLAVRSAAVLFSGIGASGGGSGDIRLILNKEADGDTASLLLQRGSSGRGEIGLTGDADLTVKVSSDGSAWTEAIRIDRDTGLATILYDNTGSGLAATNLQDAIDEIAGAGGGGAVASVFGRTGTVIAAASDYDASQIDNDSSVAGATVAAALNTLSTAVGGKQSADGDLTALAGLSSTGIAVRTGSNSWEQRAISAASGSGIGITNPGGVAGNIALDMPPGSVVQSVMGTYTANADITATIPIDDTIPQSNEGTQIISVSMTPRSATNKFRFRFRGDVWITPPGFNAIAAVFDGGSASAKGASFVTLQGSTGASEGLLPLEVAGEYAPGDTNPHTITVRAGMQTGATKIRFNGSTAARFLGGAMAASLIVEEIRA